MKSLRRMLGVLAATAVLMGAMGVQAEPVTFTKDAPLRSDARFDAAPVTSVKQGTVGEASGKKGPWLHIKVPGGAGWVLTTDVRFGGGSGAAPSSAGVSSFFGGGRRQVSATSTIGIRGFDKETIGHAFGDSAAVSTAQLALLDGFAVDKAGALSFASAQGLSATPISY